MLVAGGVGSQGKRLDSVEIINLDTETNCDVQGMELNPGVSMAVDAFIPRFGPVVCGGEVATNQPVNQCQVIGFDDYQT